MTTQAQMTENLFKNWKDIDKRVKYLRVRKMSESADGNVDYKASYFKCLEERDLARRDYEVMYKLCQGAEADVEKLKKRIQFIEPIHWVESNFEREKLASKYMEQYGYTGDTPNRDAILSAFCAGYTVSQASDKTENKLPTFAEMAKRALENKGPREKNITIKIEALTARMMIDNEA